MKARLISLPVVISPSVPSARVQYLDLAEYYEKQGDLDLARFYRNLAQEQ